MGHSSRRSHKRGFALVIALAYLLLLSLFAVAFIRLVRINMTDAFNEEARIEAVNLAQAGVEKAVAELRRNSGYRGENGTPLGGGAFTVTVEPFEETGCFRVVSEGTGEAPQRRFAHAVLTVDVKFAPDGAIEVLYPRRQERW